MNERDEEPPTRPPDAFFPGVPRVRVVLLGVLLAVVGIAVAIVVPPLTVIPESGSGQLSGFFLLLGIAIAVVGVVFLFKKPSDGSPPGSAEHERLVSKQRSDVYRSFMRDVIVGLVLSVGLAVWSLPAGIIALSNDNERGPVLIVVGIISAIGAISLAVLLHAARRGRLKHVRPPDR